ncbi:hypothetical protein A2V56_05320 [Candidatus Woesebacteria bacterium RBG_19FT_COMBO_42_9]|uniref:Uncharacterized protein n=1 Tax=Candidatus Woesebacteria bacterium RBG_16_42_24 TaxID=1802485 RepID=A0A1F7XM38_9BACT|nr:MAG: hypothetical protein A2V97_03825 [Candidatus Woesebacteria bacterium RBG_16_42_24]OGM17299.1 MAG: hypothetical protein A2V56_05320 [Candidatus Woesebacteria bacterium RBG_19FT_COMBO_42_9]OGM68022.1 MAG: hypothetical protein A2985_00970 [Candidatus Woesebacteria bacterium RIFCSPLOWO2_01_FULL_43_11]
MEIRNWSVSDSMAALKKQRLINLLPSEEFAVTTTGRILSWALSTFRYIVIVTELVVILAFISRFWLDAQNADLAEEIEQKQSLIASSKDFEREFIEVQKRLIIYKTLTSDSVSFSKIFSNISVNIPEDVLLSKISLSGESLTVDGLSPSERSIVQFAVNLEKNAGYPKTTLKSVETNRNDPSLLEFSLDVSLAKEEI